MNLVSTRDMIKLTRVKRPILTRVAPTITRIRIYRLYIGSFLNQVLKSVFAFSIFVLISSFVDSYQLVLFVSSTARFSTINSSLGFLLLSESGLKTSSRRGNAATIEKTVNNEANTERILLRSIYLRQGRRSLMTLLIISEFLYSSFKTVYSYLFGRNSIFLSKLR